VGRGLGTELFPPVDAGQFSVLMRAPAGTRIERTEELAAQVEEVIRTEVGAIDPEGNDPGSDLRLLISNIGVLNDWPAAYTPNTGPMDALLLVQLEDDRRHTSQEHASNLRRILPERFPEAEFAFDTGGMLTAALNLGLPSPIDVKVQGTDLHVAHEIARAIANVIRDVPGAVDVRVAQPLDYPALEIDVDRVKAAHLGIDQEVVIKNIVTALNSSVNFSPAFWIDPRNGNHYFMGAQYREEDIDSIATLENIPITGMSNGDGPVTLLKNIATIRRTRAPAVVDHRNITRTIDVYANVEGRPSGTVAQELEQALAESEAFRAVMAKYEPRGYRYEFHGEVASMRASFGQFVWGLVTAAILVYLVLVAQLRSFLLPAIIIGTVPLGLIGVIAALWLTGTNFGIPAFMGVILMVGIVVQYSILLVDFAVRRQREGIELREAVQEAAQQRLHPVLMTASTTAVALLPLALGLQRGGESNVPLARTMLGAVVGGTLLALLVVPALYTVVGRRLGLRSTREPTEA
jgi:multidrug efflux pump subunit AcrB